MSTSAISALIMGMALSGSDSQVVQHIQNITKMTPEAGAVLSGYTQVYSLVCAEKIELPQLIAFEYTKSYQSLLAMSKAGTPLGQGVIKKSIADNGEKIPCKRGGKK